MAPRLRFRPLEIHSINSNFSNGGQIPLISILSSAPPFLIGTALVIEHCTAVSYIVEENRSDWFTSATVFFIFTSSSFRSVEGFSPDISDCVHTERIMRYLKSCNTEFESEPAVHGPSILHLIHGLHTANQDIPVAP